MTEEPSKLETLMNEEILKIENAMEVGGMSIERYDSARATVAVLRRLLRTATETSTKVYTLMLLSDEDGIILSIHATEASALAEQKLQESLYKATYSVEEHEVREH